MEVTPEDFSGTVSQPKLYKGSIIVNLTNAEKLENAVIKGNLILIGTPSLKLTFSNITVEGNLNVSKAEADDVDFDTITVNGDIEL
ncbi:hypothetical protein [Metabacillus fastidiosus]|uniref:hypothetical protein n=1 Tax=Metabacillus fastidiosus TaxID=1458 RepID=UPI002DB68940|nr:hypothetical protein [Metabacillus fastidiosus]MEC2077842.1 hypothetical protein [Metabacillus fastidiosus]